MEILFPDPKAAICNAAGLSWLSGWQRKHNILILRKWRPLPFDTLFIWVAALWDQGIDTHSPGVSGLSLVQCGQFSPLIGCLVPLSEEDVRGGKLWSISMFWFPVYTSSLPTVYGHFKFNIQKLQHEFINPKNILDRVTIMCSIIPLLWKLNSSLKMLEVNHLKLGKK